MKRRVAKKILGMRKEHRAMFGINGGGEGWRLHAYKRRTILKAQRILQRTERRHGFPSKWS